MEIWKDIPGYEGLYKISNYGTVFSFFTGTVRSSVNAGRGYRAIQLSDGLGHKKRHYVHRLVAEAFLCQPSSDSMTVNHKNLDKTDNRVENLEWMTSQENSHHAYLNGRTDYRRPMRCDNTTGYKGISPHTGGYAVSLNGHYIGWYKNLENAVHARKEAERRLVEND